MSEALEVIVMDKGTVPYLTLGTVIVSWLRHTFGYNSFWLLNNRKVARFVARFETN